MKTKTEAQRVIDWIETHCTYSDGQWIGRQARLLPWQKEFLGLLFTPDPKTGLRQYSWALLGLPKKNGKTQLAAWLALYFLIGDGEPSPLVVCAATSDDQADLVFNAAKRCVLHSATLSQICEVYEREILVPSIPGARLRRISAATGSNDGMNISAVICDELHEWTGPRGRSLWTILTSSTAGRRQPMVLQTTTAGYDLDTVCGEQYLRGKRKEDGADDPGFLYYWKQAPEGSDIHDIEAWKTANVSWGATLPSPERYMRDQLSSKHELEIRRYNFNEFTESEEALLPQGAWAECESDLDLDPELPVHVGIDVARRHDSTAVVVAQKQGDVTVLRAKVWDNPYPDEHSGHEAWRLNVNDLENHLRALYERFPAWATDQGQGPGFYYDPALFVRSAQVLESEGPIMVEFPQSHERMAPASQIFHELVIDHRLAHDGDPVLARHVASAMAQETPRGWRISKPKGSKKKIDAVIAAAMAVARAQAPEPYSGGYVILDEPEPVPQ